MKRTMLMILLFLPLSMMAQFNTIGRVKQSKNKILEQDVESVVVEGTTQLSDDRGEVLFQPVV